MYKKGQKEREGLGTRLGFNHVQWTFEQFSHLIFVIAPWFSNSPIIIVYFEPSGSYYEPVGLTLSLGLVEVATLPAVVS